MAPSNMSDAFLKGCSRALQRAGASFMVSEEASRMRQEQKEMEMGGGCSYMCQYLCLSEAWVTVQITETNYGVSVGNGL